MRISDWSSDVCSSDLRKSYAQPFAVGAALTGRVIGVVEASRNPAYREGDMVFAMLRWADRAIATGAEDMRKIDPALAPPAAWLGRSAARRGGNECDSPCTSRWSPSPKNKTKLH